MKFENIFDGYMISEEDTSNLKETPVTEDEKRRIIEAACLNIDLIKQSEGSTEIESEQSAGCTENGDEISQTAVSPENASEQMSESETENVCEMGKYAHNKRKGRSPKRIATISAAAVMCFGMVFAFAAGYIQVSESLSSFLGIENSQDVEGMNRLLDVTAENNGWKADFKEVLGDSQNVYVRFDLVAPEDVIFDADFYNFDESDINIKEGKSPLTLTAGYAWDFEVLESEDVDGDNIIPFILSADYSGDCTGKKMDIHLERLNAYYSPSDGDEEGKDKTYDDFSLDAEISLDYTERSRNFTPQNGSGSTTIEGFECGLDTVEISPISVILDFNRKVPSDKDSEAAIYGPGSSDCELVLVMNDGTQYSEWRSWSSNSRNLSYSMIFKTEGVIHPEDVEAVIFNGETIELK